MKLNRRHVLAGAGAIALAPMASAQTPAPPVPPPQRLIDLALKNLHPMKFEAGKVSGPGWDLITSESAASEFVLFGEEHGMAETPMLVKELFLTLRPHGFDTLGIEISSPIAEDLDAAARNGLAGIQDFIKANYPGPAFYFWKAEAELIAAARAAVPGKRDVLWGVDYEVSCDRRLIKRLWDRAGSQKNSLGSSLTKLDIASQDAWKTWRDTHDPSRLFTFSGDPQLVRNVRAAWKKPDADVQRILTTLEETLEINKLYTTGKGYASNERRSALMRANFVDHINRAAAEGRKPKALFKMGENHMMRGVSWTGNFDIGSLIQEEAALRGGEAFSLLCGGGKGSHHGVIDPTVFATRDAPVDMFDQLGLGFLTDAIKEPGPMLVDLRPMRGVLSSTKFLQALNNPEAVKIVFAFDALVIWNGSTATTSLLPA